MIYECYTRIMVGLPLAQNALPEVSKGFLASLGLDADASEADALTALRDAAPRHKRNVPDRERFELAFESWLDERWSVDCAIGGVSAGGFDPKACQVWVGVRVEQFEHTAKVDMPAQYVRPRVLKKGDMTPGSGPTCASRWSTRGGCSPRRGCRLTATPSRAPKGSPRAVSTRWTG
jgi:hypothetical protein